MSKAERTRQFIVEKTAPLFNTKGYAGTSLSDMTDATGLTKGSIYGNFANKDEVALAVFDHNWSRVQALLRTAMAKHLSARAQLLALVDVYENSHLHGFPEGGCPLLNTAIEADDTHPELRSRAAAAFRAWKKHLTSVIEMGVASREFRAEVDAEQVAVTLIALIEGAVMIARLTGQPKHRKAVLPTIEHLICGLE